MSSVKAKTINLLLYDGDLSGVISIEDSSWNSGELYSAPRENVDELLKTDACSKYGVYLLLSKDMVYVGQASDLKKRINQHKVGKEWWESVVILTTKGDDLNHSDIDYLETALIKKANLIGRLDVDNKNKGNPQKVSKFREVFLGQYLEEALFLMQLIGITVFTDKPTASKTFINTIDMKTKLSLGKRSKAEAIKFLNENGMIVDRTATYAVKNEKGEFWANPQRKLLTEDWWLILNDNENMELLILHIPKDSIKVDSDHSGNGLFVRSDKMNLLDLNINASTLVDRKSGIELKTYFVKKISYK